MKIGSEVDGFKFRQTKKIKLKADNVISDELHTKLAPTGSRPGILYGLPKVHKPFVPLRPIVSSVNSHSFPLAYFWYLYYVLFPPTSILHMTYFRLLRSYFN